MNDDAPKAKPMLPAALVKAQREVRSALKSSKNEFHKYRYASAEEVLTVGRDALNDNDLSLSPISEMLIPMPAGMTGEESGGAACLLHVRYMLQHESGEHIEMETHVPVCPERAKSGGWSRPLDKALFGARTESLGYALRDLLLIPRVDAPDVSGRADRGERQAKQAEVRDKTAEITSVATLVQKGFDMTKAATTPEQRRAAWERAKAHVLAGCRDGGRTSDEAAEAIRALTEKVKAAVVAAPKTATVDPDAEHARRIDEGKA